MVFTVLLVCFSDCLFCGGVLFDLDFFLVLNPKEWMQKAGERGRMQMAGPREAFDDLGKWV